MVKGMSERDFRKLTRKKADTNGKKLYLKYGASGVRGEAEAGFPAVLRYGLPVLENGLASGKTPDEAGAAALLAILARTSDTNLLARSGPDVQEAVTVCLRGLLDADPYPDVKTLERLNQDFKAKNLSPGGSADLLSLCWMLHFLREES